MSPMPLQNPHWAAYEPRRCGPGGSSGARARGLAAGCALVACMWAASAAAQQTSSGQIYIPGPGEHGGSAPGTGTDTDAANGMIIIPGPGERAAQGAAQTAASAALPREAIGQAAQRVVPVIVTRTAFPAQPVVAAQPASVAGDSAISIDPLSARGEPPRLGANAGMQTAALAHAAKPPAPAAPAHPPSVPPAQTLAAAAQAGSKPAATPTQTPTPAPPPTPVVPAGQQDGESIHRTALAFLQQQSVGLPGKITVTVAPAFARGLAACTTLVPFMPPGARVWGSTTVGVRCAGARPWTIYLQARVSLEATYYLAAHPIAPGVLLTPADLTTREGDLSSLPRTIVTDASQAVGAVALAPIGAGTPLRQDMLRSATSVTIGQTVRVVASGPGFTISSEGSVMNNASPGQQVRVKTAGGQIISGIVKDGSTVQIQM
jgi:flagella basal body P-ring formation protein FlgA